MVIINKNKMIVLNETNTTIERIEFKLINEVWVQTDRKKGNKRK